MKIVNTSNIPSIIFDYLKQDSYDFKPDNRSISATGLLRPTREIILTRRYNDKIEVDAIDRLWSLFGTGIHSVLEKGSLSDKQEERINVKFEGFRISGKFDIIHNDCLKDFKVTSAFTLAYGSRLLEWSLQLSIYRWLYWKKNNVALLDKGYIVAILRDWANRDVGRVKNYPDSPIKEIELSLLSFTEVEKFIKDKTTELKLAEEMLDANLPKCSNDDTWNGKKCEKYCVCSLYCNTKPEPKTKKEK